MSFNKCHCLLDLSTGQARFFTYLYFQKHNHSYCNPWYKLKLCALPALNQCNISYSYYYSDTQEKYRKD